MTEASIVSYPESFDAIRNIRDDVFIKEQGVAPELEYDGLDDGALHCVVYDDGRAVGTGRMLPDGHIGRIAVKKEYRARGVGTRIVQSFIDLASARGLPEVWLSSQVRAKGFYQTMGFTEYGDIFLDADMDHINMKKSL